jgi:alpha-tubulin suppressor-like RCC1 family protein
VVVAAGAWHAAVVGKDGRVCTWGWGRYGCLGHGNEECESVPKVVQSLSGVKAVHVATGDYTTFVVSDKGDVYSFGCGESSSLGHNTLIEVRYTTFYSCLMLFNKNATTFRSSSNNSIDVTGIFSILHLFLNYCHVDFLSYV